MDGGAVAQSVDASAGRARAAAVKRGKLTGIRIHSAGVKSQSAECAGDVCCNLYSEDSILTQQDVARNTVKT